MEVGESWIRWTVRLALTLALAGMALRWFSRGRPVWQALARAAWTAGCLAFLAHVACAFHLQHHWSHTDAYAATAQRTAEVVGWNWGGGLFANYAFGLVWLGDVAWWWCGPKRYAARASWITMAVLGFLGFMSFQATVVFGVGPIRWYGLASTVFLLALPLVSARKPG